MAALEEEMVGMNSSLTATQQNSSQVGELEMRLQLLENELGRVTGEKERAVALLQEVRGDKGDYLLYDIHFSKLYLDLMKWLARRLMPFIE